MKTLNEITTQKIVNFLNSLNTEISITDYVSLDDIDFQNAFDSIFESIQDNNGFDIEIIYYFDAIEYLKENDASLMESLSIATEYGYKIEDINSEILASLLASKNAVENFYNLESNINTFFLELSEELTSLEN
jgi:hypothetical protein